ncbi:hypothetical protein LCM20_16075 [Halobacillus litoralis]|uniref:hypothetical protein n=1 Tax=Halobacillus litoralis TaxID=45668 RepID=UPI001CD5E2FB|nr:hypothetical protein [Halobacillus litoralis]MCA0972125.1 hypothetical protein [Halobacillus litoralis]
MFYLFLFLGFLVNAGILLGGMAFFKVKGKKNEFSKLLIVNLVVSALAFSYGMAGGTLNSFNDPYFVQTIGLMSFGMLAFCMIPLILYLNQIRQ